MKPSVLIAAGCSWVAGRAIDTDPVAETFETGHVEDPAFVEQYSFSGILQRKLGLDQIYFIARNGSNNDEQFSEIVKFIENNKDNYSEIFVLWGLTSIYRWQMYSSVTNQVENCKAGHELRSYDLTKEVEHYFSQHWNKEYELSKLGLRVITLNGYLKNAGVKHLFFNAFQSYNNKELGINAIPEFYQVAENNNDMLNLLGKKTKIGTVKSSWLNLLKPTNNDVDQVVVKLQKTQWLDRATAHPTVRAHSVIANELYDYIIKEKE